MKDRNAAARAAAGSSLETARPDVARRNNAPPQVRINQRFILLGLLGLIAAGAGTHVVHGIQMDRNAAALYERARTAREAGEPSVAIQYLSRYVRFRPHDYNALSELGTLLSQRSVEPAVQLRAFLTLEQVLIRDRGRSDEAEIRRRVVEAAMHLRRWNDALVHLEPLRKEQPRDPGLAALFAECQENLGDVSAAAVAYLQAITAAPAEIPAYLKLARLAARHPAEMPVRKRAESLQLDAALVALLPEESNSLIGNDLADSLLALLVERGEPKPRALLEAAAYRRSRGELEAAAQILERALALEARNVELLIASSDLSLARAEEARLHGNPEEAQKHLDAARQHAEGAMAENGLELRAALGLARIDQFAGRYDEAEAELRRAIARWPEAHRAAAEKDRGQVTDVRLQIEWTLADLLIGRASDVRAEEAAAKSRLEEAQKLAQSLSRSGTLAPLVAFLECRMLMAEEHWQRASLRLEETRPHLSNFPALVRRTDLLLGECYERLGNPDSRLQVFRRAFQSDPLWLAGRLQLAEALVAGNRMEEAIEEYRTLMAIRGIPAKVARLLVARELARPPAQRRWEAAEKLLEAARQSTPDDPQIAVLRAEVLAAQGKFDEAQALLVAGRAARPDEPALWSAAASLALARTDQDAGERLEATDALLKEARGRLGERVELRLVAAARALAEPEADLKEVIASQVENLPTFERADQVRLLEGLLGQAVRKGSVAEARMLCARLTAIDPGRVETQFTAADLALRERDFAAAREGIRAIRAIEGASGPNGNYLEASVRMQEASNDAALRESPARLADALAEPRALLIEAEQQRPQWTALPRALGGLEMLLGRRDEAIAQYQRAFELGDRSRETVVTVVEHHRRHQNWRAANEILMQVAQEDPKLVSGDLARVGWQVAWQRQNYDEALRLVQSVAEESGDFRDRIWNAHVLFARYQLLPAERRGEASAQAMLKEARGLYRTAVESAPDQPSAWFAYIYHLVSAGQKAEAVAAIDEARQKLPEKPPHIRPVNLAQYYELVGDLPAAETHYDAAVATATEDAALRVVAADFFTRTGQFAKAEEHLAKILDPASKAPEFAVSWARVRRAMSLATTGGYDDATRALEQLRGTSGEASPSQLEALRAQIAILSKRQTHRDRRALIEVLDELHRRKAATRPEQVQLAALCERTGQTERARAVVEEILHEEPGNADALSWLALSRLRAHEAAGEGDGGKSEEDLAECADLVARLSEVEPDSHRTLEARVRLLHSMKDGGKGETLIRDFVKRVESALAKSAEGRGAQPAGATQAVAQIQGLAELCEQLSSLALAEELFRLAAEKSKEPDAVLDLAAFLARQGRLDEAFALCEENEARCSPERLALSAVNFVFAAEVSAGHTGRARAIVEAAAKRRPSSPLVLNALAMLRTTEPSGLEDAESIYRHVLRDNPQNVATLNNLAFLLAVTGKKPDEARSLIQEAIALAGPLPALLDTRAIVRMRQDQVKEAIADLEEAIANEPTAGLHFHLALAHARGKNAGTAREAFDEAKNKGFRAAQLHPLERDAYAALMKVIEAK